MSQTRTNFIIIILEKERETESIKFIKKLKKKKTLTP